MAWLNESNSDWIKTEKTVSTDFSQSFDFTGDNGARYAAVFVNSNRLVEEKRGLTETAAIALASATNASDTRTAKTFTDNQGSSPRYSVTVPAIEGSYVSLEARRDNDARGWIVVRTTTTQTATATWGSGSYSATALSTSGTQKAASVRYYTQNLVNELVPAVTVDGVPTSWRRVIVNIKYTETTEEWSGLTETAAKQMAANFGATLSIYWNGETSWEGASSEAEARFAGTNAGWTVRRVSRTSVIVGNS